MLCLGFLSSLPALSAEGTSSGISIDHADSLELTDEQITLSGSVRVRASGEQIFALSTEKLVATKADGSDDFSRIETFGASSIETDRFLLTAPKFFFTKSPGSAQFDSLETLGESRVTSKDDSTVLVAPAILVKLKEKKLYATKQVVTEQKIGEQGSIARISSNEQVIDLDETVKTLSKQLTAIGTVQAIYEGATVTSDLAELFSLAGQAQNLIFKQNAKLITTNGVKGQAEQIDYGLLAKNLKLSSLKKASILKVPFQNGTGKPPSEMTVTARDIDYQERESKSILQAEELGSELVLLELETKRGLGHNLLIYQDSSIPEKQGDYLVLTGEASVTDLSKDERLFGDFIRLDFGTQKLTAGSNRQSSGSVPMKKRVIP